MKKFPLLLLAILTLIIASCSKEYDVPVFTPKSNTWIINTDTFGPTTFVYNDTFNQIYGKIKGIGSVTVSFVKKPKSDGEYAFRVKADETNELSILIVDSVKNIQYQSTDNDGLELKKEQFAKVLVNGSQIGVSFNNMWLKRTDNPDKAKVSLNIE